MRHPQRRSMSPSAPKAHETPPEKKHETQLQAVEPNQWCALSESVQKLSTALVAAAEGISRAEVRIQDLEQRVDNVETSSVKVVMEVSQQVKASTARADDFKHERAKTLAAQRDVNDSITARMAECERVLQSHFSKVETEVVRLDEACAQVNSVDSVVTAVALKLNRLEEVLPALTTQQARLKDEVKLIAESAQEQLDETISKAMALVAKASQSFEHEFVVCRDQQNELVASTIEATVKDLGRELRKSQTSQINAVRADVVEARAKWNVLCAQFEGSGAAGVQGRSMTCSSLGAQFEGSGAAGVQGRSMTCSSLASMEMCSSRLPSKPRGDYLQFTFEPGAVGLHFEDCGKVVRVDPGGQADRLGVPLDSCIVTVNGDTWTDSGVARLREAVGGNSHYNIVMKALAEATSHAPTSAFLPSTSQSCFASESNYRGTPASEATASPNASLTLRSYCRERGW